MSDAAVAVAPAGWRRTTFIVVTVVFGLALGVAGFAFLALVAPWFGIADREVHIVHDLAWGAHGGVLIALPMLIQSVKPERKPALMLGIALAVLALMLGYGLAEPQLGLLLPVAIVGVLWWLHPARSEVARVGSPQPLLAALAIAAAIPLVMYAVDQIGVQQVCAGDRHCEEFHWAGMAGLAFALPLVGLCASFRTQGWPILARLVGGAALVFGLSGILYPDHASSIGPAWGGITIAGGVLFVLVAEWTARQPPSSPGPA